jgi:hypothetical protein
LTITELDGPTKPVVKSIKNSIIVFRQTGSIFSDKAKKMLKFSILLVLFLISPDYVEAQGQSSWLGSILNSFGYGVETTTTTSASAPTTLNNEQNKQVPLVPRNPCPYVFEYVRDEKNVIEGEIKLKTSYGRDTVVDLVFEANVPGSLTSVFH